MYKFYAIVALLAVVIGFIFAHKSGKNSSEEKPPVKFKNRKAINERIAELLAEIEALEESIPSEIEDYDKKMEDLKAELATVREYKTKLTK